MAKSSRTQSAPRSKSAGGFLLGVFVGLLAGLAIALGIALYMNKTPIPFMTKKASPEKAAEPGKAAEIAGMPSGKAAPGEKPKFDFYKILPGSEEPVSEKELKAAAKSAPEGSKDIYFLQAGSFQNPADADNRKAQLAILGFEASVEPTNLPDKGTWYRVRLGPYSKVDEINKVRSTLATNGIDVSLVKIKDPAAAKADAPSGKAN